MGRLTVSAESKTQCAAMYAFFHLVDVQKDLGLHYGFSCETNCDASCNSVRAGGQHPMR